MNTLNTQQQISTEPTEREFAPPRTPAEMWPNAIEGEIKANELHLGVGVRIESGVQIIADKVTLGDFTYIGRNSRIIVPEIEIGDYTRINELAFLGGTKPMQIGLSCYFGRGVQLDSTGGLKIGNYVGVGSLSQVWTHIRFGDVVQGCIYDSEHPLTIEDDVWLVGRVVISNAKIIRKRTIIFNESNLIPSIDQMDAVYMGNPAQSSTRFKPQFASIPDTEKQRRLQAMIDKFEARYPLHKGRLKACISVDEFNTEDHITYFAVRDRVYTKKYWDAEVSFLRDRETLAKFAPMIAHKELTP